MTRMARSEMLECELAVIGCGLSGMAAALCAAQKNISTVQAGVTGGLVFASGYLDLMGVYPMAAGSVWEDPWAAIEAVCRIFRSTPMPACKRKPFKALLRRWFHF